ncbi:vesicle-associated membrane protein-associated protein A-like [Rhodnius prolixus]|uniref:vesicle-associated membrane protein-associated protein A-like n=1 Tax=Rhodnius prolixus TaxID=13249 RepID=UPI003D18EFC0
MPKQILILDPPEELVFNAPFNDKCFSYLELTNPTPYSVCYKVKATATFRYFVKPKMGLLLPYSQQIVQFKLKDGKGDKLDKFKILSAISPNCSKDLVQLWEQEIDDAAIMQSKLTTNFIGEWKQQQRAELSESLKPLVRRRSYWIDVVTVCFLPMLAYFVVSLLLYFK